MDASGSRAPRRLSRASEGLIIQTSPVQSPHSEGDLPDCYAALVGHLSRVPPLLSHPLIAEHFDGRARAMVDITLGHARTYGELRRVE
jgi:hypothetical protein